MEKKDLSNSILNGKVDSDASPEQLHAHIELLKKENARLQKISDKVRSKDASLDFPLPSEMFEERGNSPWLQASTII